jgi:hypothetical protein
MNCGKQSMIEPHLVYYFEARIAIAIRRFILAIAVLLLLSATYRSTNVAFVAISAGELRLRAASVGVVDAR